MFDSSQPNDNEYDLKRKESALVCGSPGDERKHHKRDRW